MTICELCRERIVGPSYLAGIKEMPSKEGSTLGKIIAQLVPKSWVIKPICGACATETKATIERMRK